MPFLRNGIKNALIEHGHGINREDVEMMKAKGTFLVPTIAVIDRHIEAANRKNAFTPQERKRVEGLLEGIQQEIQMAKSLGIKIAAGFDPGSARAQGKNATELEAMVKRGLTPLEAIQAATINAAELLNWKEDIGALEPGHYADVIAVDGNPLADITVLQQVRWVMKGGMVVKGATETARAQR